MGIFHLPIWNANSCIWVSIYDLGFQSPDSEAAKPMVFATALLLILLVITLNLAAILTREKLRKKYAGGAF